MTNIKRSTTVGAALLLMVGLSFGASPVALAAGTKPKPMNISATGGDNTTITDSVEGTATDSVQGKEDTDGDQDAHDLTKSEDATPQDKAPNKMTK